MKKILAEKPLDSSTLHQRVDKETGVGYYAVEAIIRKMTEQKPPLIENEYSNMLDDYLYKLPEQKLPQLEDYKDQILQMIQEKPHTAQEIQKKLLDMDVQIKSGAVTTLLNELSSEDTIVRTQGYDGKYYYHMAHHDPLVEQTKTYEEYVLEYVKAAEEEDATANPRAKQIAEGLNYKFGLSWNNMKKIFKGMFDKKLLYVYEGDFDDPNDGWGALITTKPVSHDPKAQKLQKYEKLILDRVNQSPAFGQKSGKTTTAKDAGNAIYGGSHLGKIESWTKIKAIIQGMLDKKLLHIKSGDWDDPDSCWNAYVTTDEVDPATVVKHPGLEKAEQLAVAFLTSKLKAANAAPGPGACFPLLDVGGHVKSQVPFSDWPETKKIMKLIIKSGKIHVPEPLDDYDFWDQFVTLPPQQQPGQPLPPQQQPGQPSPPQQLPTPDQYDLAELPENPTIVP